MLPVYKFWRPVQAQTRYRIWDFLFTFAMIAQTINRDGT
jgi:hypothetical protein